MKENYIFQCRRCHGTFTRQEVFRQFLSCPFCFFRMFYYFSPSQKSFMVANETTTFIQQFEEHKKGNDK